MSRLIVHFTGAKLGKAQQGQFHILVLIIVSQQVCIVFTDGQAIDEDNLEEASQKWAENNVTVFAVGIGSEVERETLRKIAGNESRILWAEDFDQLANITNDLKKIVCVAVGEIIKNHPKNVHQSSKLSDPIEIYPNLSERSQTYLNLSKRCDQN